MILNCLNLAYHHIGAKVGAPEGGEKEKKEGNMRVARVVSLRKTGSGCCDDVLLIDGYERANGINKN